jgi:o-succinylbenzoate synthase
MKITLYHYALPCQTGVVLRKQTLTMREGLIIQLKQQDKIGLGEIAPLPGFSQESLKEAQAAAIQWALKPHSLWDRLPPSVAFGISCAFAELHGELGSESNFQSAILCDGNFATFSEKIAQQSQPLGKIKVGFNHKQEGELANQLFKQFPHLTLRLDANRAWNLAQAVEFAEQIAKPHRSRIQFIEEPCQLPAQSLQFAAQTGIAIAWDETVREPNFCVQKAKNLNAIVLKPTLIGSLNKCINLIKRAHQLGLNTVISSSIESTLGLSQLARMAQQYTPNMTPGLDTANLMQHQLLRPFAHTNLPLVGFDSAYLQEIPLCPSGK